MKMGMHNNDERLLAHMPATRRKLIEITGMPTRTAYNVVKRLHEDGKIHIIGWERTHGGGPFVQIWQAGPGDDAYCQLRPMTQSQIWRRYKAKAIKSGANDFKLAAKRARYHADKRASAKTKATWLSALGMSI
jgi:hypothetical protein